MLRIAVSVIFALGLLSCNLLVREIAPPVGHDTFTVSFDSQGGSTPNPAFKTVILGTPYGTLPMVTRSGYYFGNWWTGIGGTGSLIQPITIVTTKTDHTLYAHWVAAMLSPWARTVSAGTEDSEFYNVAVDSSGNVYAAGYQYGTGNYTYGSGVSAAGSSVGENVVLVKYNSSGNALWARTVSSGTQNSRFVSVAVDSNGDVYAAGYQTGTDTFTYGSGVSATGISTGPNVVLVKYNSSGNALWAKTVNAGSNTSFFNSVGVDFSGNVYAAGYQYGTGTFTYGSGVSAAGTSTVANVVLVKYNSSGNALWAKTVSSGYDNSRFFCVALDSNGNVYAAGSQTGIGTFTYGPGVSATGISTGPNVVLVKYNSSGNALWARTVSSGTHNSQFFSVAVDSSGNVYTAGSQTGTGTFTYGPGVSIAGTYSGFNVVLVKYDSGGAAQWAKTVVSGSNASGFNSVAVDAIGNVYAAGFQSGNGSFDYGGASATASSTSDNVVLVKYNASGNALWAKTVSSGIEGSSFSDVTVDSADLIFAAGYQTGMGTFTYGSGVSVTGTSTGANVVLVKYAP